MRTNAAFALLVVLAALLASCEAATRQDRGQCPKCPSGIPETAPPPGDFAFYFLVRQWPNEFCFKQKGCFRKPDPAAGFTLHGLWPNLDNPCQQDYPEHCSRQDGFDKFDLSSIDRDTLDDMATNWPSYTTENPCFWSHEWDCHGSCSGLSQQDYFQKVLDLHAKYDIAAALADANITPSNNPVSTSDFEAALTSKFGAAPLLYCQRGGSNDFINEIYMCVTRDLEVVDCNEVCRIHPCQPQTAQDCGSDLIYKLGPVDSKAQKPCTDSFRQCRPKSGTCHL